MLLTDILEEHFDEVAFAASQWLDSPDGEIQAELQQRIAVHIEGMLLDAGACWNLFADRLRYGDPGEAAAVVVLVLESASPELETQLSAALPGADVSAFRSAVALTARVERFEAMLAALPDEATEGGS